MTILDKNRDINELIKNGILKKKYLDDEHEYTYTLKNNRIFCDEFSVGRALNTIEKRMEDLSHEARRAYYVEKILESVGISINDLETGYKVITFMDISIIFIKKENNTYTFIELYNSKYEYGQSLTMVRLNADRENLVYDRIDLNKLKHYHKEGKISEFTLNKINQRWDRRWEIGMLNENDLSDVIAADVPFDGYHAWSRMSNYGNLVGDLDLSKLDTDVCMVDKDIDGTAKIYYR